MIGNIAFGVFGLAVLISFAYTVSSNKKSIDWKQISAGVGLQIVFCHHCHPGPWRAGIF
jgi:CNT family concentrative nucleoside transporter